MSARKLFVFGLLCIPFMSWAQPSGATRFDYISTTQGLSQNSINAIAQDWNGFMWFATQEGLDRFDPNDHVTSFVFTDSISNDYHQEVRLILADHSSKSIWASSENQLRQYIYSSSKNKIDEQRYDLPRNIWIVSLLRGKQQFFFCSSYGLFRANTSSQAIDSVKLSQQIGTIMSAVADSVSDQAYIGTDRGVFQVALTSGRATQIYYSNTVRALFQYSKDKLYVVDIYGSLTIIDLDSPSKKATQLTYADPANLKYSPSVTSLCKFKDEILVGTDNLGVFVVDNGKLVSRYRKTSLYPESINSNLIKTMYTSREGILWVGTNGLGVNKVSRTRFRHLLVNASKGEPLNNDVWSIVQDDKYAWIGTDGNGVVKVNLRTGAEQWMSRVDYFSKYTYVVHCIVDRGVDLLVGTDVGLSILPKSAVDKGVPRPLYHVQQGESWYGVLSMVRLGSGEVWLVTNNQIHVLDSKLKFVRRVSLPDEELYVRHLDKTKDDRWVFISTEQGVYKASTDSTIQTVKISDTNAFSTFAENDSVWIATKGKGIEFISTGTHGFIDNNNALKNVFGIVRIGPSKFWCSSTNGLNLISITKADTSYITYSEKNGLQHSEFNQGAFFSIGPGNPIFFGGVNGVNLIEDELRTDEDYFPKLYLSDGDQIAFPGAESDTLRVGKRKDGINPVAQIIDYHNNLDAEIQYRLESNVWRSITPGISFQIRTDQLASGTHRVDVRYKIEDREWQNGHFYLKVDNVMPVIEFFVNLPRELKALVIFIIAFPIAGFLINLYNRRKLQLLQDRINEVSRCDTYSDVAKTAVTHLTQMEPFRFAAARVIHLDYVKRKATVVAWKNWPEPEEGMVKSIVFSGKPFLAADEEIRGVNVLIGQEPITVSSRATGMLRKKIIPMVKRVHERNSINSSEDFIVGIVEINVGYKPFAFLASARKRLDLYIDNCAQPYSRALTKTIQENIKERITHLDNSETDPDATHQDFGRKGLKELCNELNVDAAELNIFKGSSAVRELYFGDASLLPPSKEISSQEIQSWTVRNDPEESMKPFKSQLDIQLDINEKRIGSVSLYALKSGQFDTYRAVYSRAYLTEFLDFYLKRKVNFNWMKIVQPFDVFANLTNAGIRTLQEHFPSDEIAIWGRHIALENNQDSEFVSESLTTSYKISGKSHERAFRYFQLPGNNIDVKLIESGELFLGQKAVESNEPAISRFLELNKLKSYVLFPFCIGNMNYGFVGIFSYDDRPLGLDERVFLNHFTSKYSHSLVTSKLIQFISSANEHWADQGSSQIMNIIARYGAEILQAEPIVFFGYDSANKVARDFKVFGSLQVNTNVDFYKNVKGRRIEFVEKLISCLESEQYFESRDDYNAFIESHNLNIDYENPQDFWTREHIQSLATIKIENRGYQGGVIMLNYRSPKKFTAEMKQFMQIFAKIGQVAFIQARMIQDKEEVSRNNLRLLNPIFTGTILNGMMHNTKTLFNNLETRFVDGWAKLQFKTATQKGPLIGPFLDVLKKDMDILKGSIVQFETYWKDKEIKKEKLLLNDVIRDAINVVNKSLDANRVELQWNEASSEEMAVLANRPMMTEVFINVLRNANEAIPKSRRGKISIDGKLTAANRFKVTIRDNGIGVIKDNQALIFEPFQTFGKVGGSGLGLAISREVMKNHDGLIALQSGANTTSVTLELPIIN